MVHIKSKLSPAAIAEIANRASMTVAAQHAGISTSAASRIVRRAGFIRQTKWVLASAKVGGKE